MGWSINCIMRVQLLLINSVCDCIGRVISLCGNNDDMGEYGGHQCWAVQYRQYSTVHPRMIIKFPVDGGWWWWPEAHQQQNYHRED